jgi:Tfp pilus assembly protein PilZ
MSDSFLFHLTGLDETLEMRSCRGIFLATTEIKAVGEEALYYVWVTGLGRLTIAGKVIRVGHKTLNNWKIPGVWVECSWPENGSEAQMIQSAFGGRIVKFSPTVH